MSENKSESKGLVREFKLLEAVTIGVGGMIGGGIFAAIGQVTRLADDMVLYSLLFCTIAALLTGYNYAKLAEKFPSSGASYTYVSKGFGQKLGSSVAWLLWFGYSSASAFYAVSFGLYLGHFINVNWRILSLGLIAIMTLINLGGLKYLGKSENAIVFGKISILIVFIIAGLFFINVDKVTYMANPINLSSTPSLINTILGGALIFIAYEGFELIATSAEELNEPEKNIKIAIFLSIITVSIVYMLSVIVSLSVVNVTEFSSSEAPLVIAAEKFLGPLGGIMMGIGAVLSTSSALNASIYGSSRILYSLARDGGAPKKLAEINNRTNIPQYSVLFTAMLATILVTLGVVEEVSALSSMFFLMIFLMVNLTSIKLTREAVIRVNYAISLIATIMVTIPIGFILAYLMTPLLWTMLFVSLIIAFVISSIILKHSERNTVMATTLPVGNQPVSNPAETL